MSIQFYSVSFDTGTQEYFVQQFLKTL